MAAFESNQMGKWNNQISWFKIKWLIYPNKQMVKWVHSAVVGYMVRSSSTPPISFGYSFDSAPFHLQIRHFIYSNRLIKWAPFTQGGANEIKFQFDISIWFAIIGRMEINNSATHLDEAGEEVEIAPCAHYNIYVDADAAGDFLVCEDCGAGTEQLRQERFES
jgi:hypothetical protein